MKAIKASISEVMETMFFLSVEFGEELKFNESKIDQGKPIMGSQLKFNGDVSGSMCIFVPKDLIIQMTENFMGEPKDQLTNEHLSGTLTEMLNMVCGNAFSKRDPKAPFEMGIPKMIKEINIQNKEMITIVKTPQSKMAILLEIN